VALILAIESATDAAGVALADDDGLLASSTVGRGRRHAETIAPAITAVCATAGVGLGEVDAVAVDVGPGLFTGLRVGIATAKALATGRSLPVVAVSSLDVLAAAAAAAGVTSVLSVVDARRGEVFWARYDAVADGGPLDGDGAAVPVAPDGSVAPDGVVALDGPTLWRRASARVGPPDVLAAEIRTVAPEQRAGLVLVGDGAQRYAAVIGLAGGTVAGPGLAHPPVAVLAAIGVRRFERGEVWAADEVRAEYLREADARRNWVRR
jgi:tRNA threonylcarbamoyladenosine biosynthesis protein TsaB